MTVCISLCPPDFTELKIKAQCLGERNRKASNDNSIYLWILIKHIPSSLQQNDLFFQNLGSKGKLRTKAGEKRMETVMGLSKCRIIFGKAVAGNMESAPARPAAGGPGLGGISPTAGMKEYRGGMNTAWSFLGFSPMSNCSLTEETRYIFESLKQWLVQIIYICPAHSGLP